MYMLQIAGINIFKCKLKWNNYEAGVRGRGRD